MEENHEALHQPESEQEDIFVIVIHGFAPEFYDGVAFRKDKTRKSRPKKNVFCPYCHNQFETIDASTKVEVFRCSVKSTVKCHKVRHCKICHGIVGVRFA